MEKEKFEVELALRKNQEALLREEEMKEAEAKRLKMVELQHQMMIDVEETRKRREIGKVQLFITFHDSFVH